MGISWRTLENNIFNCFKGIICPVLGHLCVISISWLYKMSRKHKEAKFLGTRDTKLPQTDLTPLGSPDRHKRREETAHIPLMSVHSEG